MEIPIIWDWNGFIAEDVKSSVCILFMYYISLIQLQTKCYNMVETKYFLPQRNTLVNNQEKRENAFCFNMSLKIFQ